MFSYLKLSNVSIIIALVFISAFIQQTSSFRVNLRGDEDNLLKKILQDKYTDFVNKLGDNIKDSKFREAIRRLGESNEVKSEILAIKVKKLIPTQNEIDIDKSLKWGLTSVESLNLILYCYGPVKIGGNSIVTSHHGKYIIDGHHRWSQVYSFNPECAMSSVDLTNINDPFNALKATQLGIVAGKDANGNDITSIPVAKVEGRNLLTITKPELMKYVAEKMKKEVLQAFTRFNEKLNSAESVGEYIWGNISKFQKRNQPVEGAPERAYMPQTDRSPEWIKYAVNVEKVFKKEKKNRD